MLCGMKARRLSERYSHCPGGYVWPNAALDSLLDWSTVNLTPVEAESGRTVDELTCSLYPEPEMVSLTVE